MFKWITKDHEIAVGFKHIGHGKCSICNAHTSKGSTICDKCFEQEKKVSKK